MVEREIAGWITAFGNHIPIYSDDPNIDSYRDMWDREQKNKEGQIQKNKEQADIKQLQDNGYKGNYKLYRAGDLSGASTGMVYFTPDKNEADRYARPSSFKMQGTTFKREARQVNDYNLNIKKPLVVTGDDDTSRAKNAFQKLYPNKDVSKLRDYAKSDGQKITGYNSQMLYLDRTNGKALKLSEYDSIVYTNHDGKVTQVILLAGDKRLGRKGN